MVYQTSFLGESILIFFETTDKPFLFSETRVQGMVDVHIIFATHSK
jgi:hypothetical protein